jgi:hypothetical protein
LPGDDLGGLGVVRCGRISGTQYSILPSGAFEVGFVFDDEPAEFIFEAEDEGEATEGAAGVGRGGCSSPPIFAVKGVRGHLQMHEDGCPPSRA